MGAIELLLGVLAFCSVLFIFLGVTKQHRLRYFFSWVLLPLIVLLPILFGFWFRALSYQVTAEAPKAAHQAIDGVEQVADNLSDTLGDLEKELDKFTKPQIDLGEEPTKSTTKDETVEEAATELESEPKLGEPLPDWVTDPPGAEEGVWQRVVSTEPSFTLESLARTQKELVRETLAKYWPEHVDEVLPEAFSRWLDNRSDQPGIILDQHTEHRETSVGEAFVSHVLFRVGEPEKEWFSQQWKAWKTKERLANRGMRVAGIGLLSGAVLCGLAVLYGLLRMSEK